MSFGRSDPRPVASNSLRTTHGPPATGRRSPIRTPRTFLPNLQTKRIWVAELGRFVTVKLTARALKTITKNGAFQTLKKAGLV